MTTLLALVVLDSATTDVHHLGIHTVRQERSEVARCISDGKHDNVPAPRTRRANSAFGIPSVGVPLMETSPKGNESGDASIGCCCAGLPGITDVMLNEPSAAEKLNPHFAFPFFVSDTSVN